MSCTKVGIKSNSMSADYSLLGPLVKERRQSFICLVDCYTYGSFYVILSLSHCGGCFLHLLASIPQSTNHVCCCHFVWRMDSPPSEGSTCAFHGLRYNLDMCPLDTNLAIVGVFYYFNSILNPILYTILSKRFRRGFNDMTDKCWICKVLPYQFNL